MQVARANPTNIALERSAIDAEWRAVARGSTDAAPVVAMREQLERRHAAHLAYVRANLAALPATELAKYASYLARQADTATVRVAVLPFWDLADLAEVATRDAAAAAVLGVSVRASSMH